MTSHTIAAETAQVVRNILTRSKWAERITGAWQRQVQGIFETASLLETAKAELRKADWAAMVATELPFSRSAANKPLKIAACDHLRNEDHGPHCRRTGAHCSSWRC